MSVPRASQPSIGDAAVVLSKASMRGSRRPRTHSSTVSPISDAPITRAAGRAARPQARLPQA